MKLLPLLLLLALPAALQATITVTKRGQPITWFVFFPFLVLPGAVGIAVMHWCNRSAMESPPPLPGRIRFGCLHRGATATG
jgi:hypothetical protein